MQIPMFFKTEDLKVKCPDLEHFPTDEALLPIVGLMMYENINCILGSQKQQYLRKKKKNKNFSAH